MNDVIGSYERIEEMYRLYVNSAFPMRSAALAAERDQLLRQEGMLSRPPVIEPVPVYPSSDLTIDQAAEQLPDDYRDLPALAKRVMPHALYAHQWESLQRALLDDQDLVVTTGTGSGKTECFLLPLLASLAHESSSWNPVDPLPAGRMWWRQQGAGRGGQWHHVRRPSAVRAMVLYPLNALVEDQLRRLRSALDDDETHAWLDGHRGGNRITFGRYTGQTPVSGKDNARATQRLRRSLREVDDQWQAVLAWLSQDAGRDRDVRYYFPRPDGGEMWSRWDMQDTPPDILVTNYSMLNIMLMRSIEAPIFDRTRQWLRDPDHPERRFHLVVDELHSYRGTPGTEVAYLIRLLLHRIGLTPDSPQLRILTTTASLSDDDQGRRFLKDFFGRSDASRFAWISGSQTPPTVNSRHAMAQHAAAFARFAKAVQPDPLEAAPEPDLENAATAMVRLAGELSGADGSTGGAPVRTLGSALIQAGAPDALRDATRAFAGGELRPRLAPALDHVLFPQEPPTRSVSDAMRGMLLALGMAQTGEYRSPQPVRGHFFFRNMQGLWACSNPSCTEPSVDVLARQQEPPTCRPPIGSLHAEHRITCGCGARVYEIHVCEVCGEILLGAYRKAVALGGVWGDVLTADQPDLEGIPDRVELRRRHGDYALFWPLCADAAGHQPCSANWRLQGIQRSWRRAWLDPWSGLVRTDHGAKPDGNVPGWIYAVAGTQPESQPAFPSKCPRCDADYGRRQHGPKTPIRQHRTGFAKATQVLTVTAMGETANVSDSGSVGAKLVAFVDSRQDAAKLSAGIERDHFRDLARLALYQSYRQFWPSVAAFMRTSREGMQQSVLARLPSRLREDLAAPNDPDDVRLRDRFIRVIGAQHPRVLTVAMAWLNGINLGMPDAETQWQELLGGYLGPVPLRYLVGAVRDDLLALGVCPGGGSYWMQHVRQGPPWWKCYSWGGQKPQAVEGDDKLSEHRGRMGGALTAELMYALFPHAAWTFESLGFGWLTYNRSATSSDQVVATVEAIIRQLGVRREFEGYAVPGNSTSLRASMSTYAQQRGVDPQVVIDELLSSGAGTPGDSGILLKPEGLLIALPDGDGSGYRCPACQGYWLHNVGACPECSNHPALEAAELAATYDYYRRLLEGRGAGIQRLNCEELTGQTDRSDRTARQRWFQDIFVGDELPRVQGVDLLSVTTTMEAGVDIGSLNAVLLANMPPRRFNYQQRVGRAGRRAGGVSLALTFCRGRSHDDFYFDRPEAMTGDQPPSPYVDLQSEPIFRRCLAKEVLRRAFDSLGVFAGATDSVHGEFGDASDWPTCEGPIAAWIADPHNGQALAKTVSALAHGTPHAAQTDHWLLWLRQALVPLVRNCVRDPRFTNAKLSERLANAGLLPMFGFPTRVRLLHTRRPRKQEPWPPETGVIDRNLDIAIGQFAPGSQTVKDKAVHRAAGVIHYSGPAQPEPGFRPALPDANAYATGICDACQAVVGLPDTGLLVNAHTQPDYRPCPVCGDDTLRALDAREPQGFITDQDPTDFNQQFEWQPRSTRPTLAVAGDDTGFVQVRNCSIRVPPSEQAEVVSINDNGGEGGFDFFRSALDPTTWVVPDLGVTTQGPGYRVALLARRVTDVLLVRIDDWPEGILADPRTVEGRAAWYSFAFWLRKAAGLVLDVDPVELQAGFQPTLETGGVVGRAFLCDQLENGAGYCRWLAEPGAFQRLLDEGRAVAGNSVADAWLSQNADGSEGHASVCDTSCNHCLRDFYNMPYHGLLDWRLALDLARLASDSKSSIDLNTPWGESANPWAQLVAGPQAPVLRLLQQLRYEHCPQTFAGLTSMVQKHWRKVLVFRHPLWTDGHPLYQKALQEAISTHPGYDVQAINPFRALRRPGDYCG